MSLIEKKQAEVEILLRDVRSIQEEINQILEMTKKVSEKMAEIGNNVIKAAPNIGNLAKIIAKGTKFKGASKEIGAVAGLITEQVGRGLAKAGEWYAERKQRKLNEKMLSKKQEIAKEKKASIERLLPKITSDKEKIANFCKMEINGNITDYEPNRLDSVFRSAKELFEGYFILNHCKEISEYMLAEFEAWLRGEHESDKEYLDSSIVYLSSVGNLVSWSSLPTSNAGFSIFDKLTIGSGLLLKDKDIVEYSSSFEEVSNISKWLISNKTKAYLLPFSSKAKKFKECFSLISDSEVIRTKIFERKKRRIIYSLIFVVLAALSYWIFF